MAKDGLPKLATKAISSAIGKLERKISGKGVIRAGKVFTLFISNEDMNDINKIVVSEKSDLLIDSATETLKREIKNKKVDFLGQ